LTHWLREITDTKDVNFDSVRKLEFNYIKRPYLNNRSEDNSLLAACANLVQHTLTFTVKELSIRDNGNTSDPTLGVFKVRGITGDEFLANMSLAPLFNCARL